MSVFFKYRDALMKSILCLGYMYSLTSTACAAVDEIVVIDTRLDPSLFGKGATLSMTREKLDARQAADVEQIFAQIPGFSVSRAGKAGAVSEVFQRGAESNFTLVFVDGIRVNNAANTRGGGADFSLIDIQGIERIDVASGAMSAIYGSDAMAGVVRIRSRWEAPGGSSLRLERGSDTSWRASASSSFALSDHAQWGVRAGIISDDDTTFGSKFKLVTFGSQLKGSFTDIDWSINLRSAQRNRSSFPEVSGGSRYAVSRKLETSDASETAAGFEANWGVNPRWTSRLYLSNDHIADDTVTPAVLPGRLMGQPAFASLVDYRNLQIGWINNIKIDNATTMVIGTDVTRERGRDNGYINFGFILGNAYRLERSASSIFAELGHRNRSDLVINAAMRIDRSSEGKNASGRVGFEKTFAEGNGKIWLNTGSGYKLPSFFALGNPLFGNPALRIERALDIKLGFGFKPAPSLDTSVELQTSRYKDLIDFDFESFKNVNRGRVQVRGISIRTTWQATHSLQLDADADLFQFDSPSGPLRRRPEHIGGAGITWQTSSGWQLNSSIRYVGSRLITSIPTGDILGSAAVVGSVTVQRTFASQRVWFAVDNVLDQHLVSAPGFPSPGVRARLGAQLTLR